MRVREGFTITELLVVSVLIGIVAAVVVPSITRSMAQGNLDRAAAVVQADLRLAHSMAARQRRPVRVVIDTAQKFIRVRDFTATTVYNERWFTDKSQYPMQRMQATTLNYIVYPNGLTAGQLDITLTAGGRTRLVRMTRAGQIRISAP